MAGDFARGILEQLDFYWTNWRPRLTGLTDAEFFWEPVADCWTVRPVPGGHIADWAPDPDPAPFTTIAWRLGHVAVGVFGMRASAHFGDGSIRVDRPVYPASADAALNMLDEQYDAWRNGLAGLDEAGWSRAVGSAEGPYAKLPYTALALHLNRELFHHGGEMALLRDLYRASRGGRAFRAET